MKKSRYILIFDLAVIILNAYLGFVRYGENSLAWASIHFVAATVVLVVGTRLLKQSLDLDCL